jgi:peroxiredoxin
MRAFAPALSPKVGALVLVAWAGFGCRPGETDDGEPSTGMTGDSSTDGDSSSSNPSESSSISSSSAECGEPPSYIDDLPRDLEFSPVLPAVIESLGVHERSAVLCGQGFVARIADATVAAPSQAQIVDFPGRCDAIASDGAYVVAIDSLVQAYLYKIEADLSLRLISGAFPLYSGEPETQQAKPRLEPITVYRAHVDQNVALVAAGGLGTLMARYSDSGFVSLPRKPPGYGDAVGVTTFSDDLMIFGGNQGMVAQGIEDDTPAGTYFVSSLVANGLEHVISAGDSQWVALWAGTSGADIFKVIDAGAGPNFFPQYHLNIEDTDVRGVAHVGMDDFTLEASRLVRSVQIGSERVVRSVEELDSMQSMDRPWMSRMAHLHEDQLLVTQGAKLLRFAVAQDERAPHLAVLANAANVVLDKGVRSTGIIGIRNGGDEPLVIDQLELIPESKFSVQIIDALIDPQCEGRRIVASQQSARIVVEFHGELGERVSEELVVHSNDPDQPTVRLALVANAPQVSAQIGETMPNFYLPRAKGRFVELNQERGRFVAIEFISDGVDDRLTKTAQRYDYWYAQCPPDRLTTMIVYSGRFSGERLAQVHDWLAEKTRILTPLLFDPFQEVIGVFWNREDNSRLYPLRVLIDPEGKIVYADEDVRLDGLENAIREQAGCTFN